MSRDIKFRAWDKEFKRFSESPLKYPVEDINYHTDYIWMQYTGLKDSKGVEIYEGDILKVPDLYETPENTSTTYHYEKVYFEKFGFRTEYGVDEDDWDYMTEDGEVIGNIYENPEILERESK